MIDTQITKKPKTIAEIHAEHKKTVGQPFVKMPNFQLGMWMFFMAINKPFLMFHWM